MDEVELLRNVGGHLTPPIGTAKARARQVLLARIDREGQPRLRSVLPHPFLPARGVSGWTWLRVAGAAVALATLLVMVGAPWTTRELSTANAAALLNDLASIAAAQPTARVPTSGYRYTKVESTYQNMMVLRGGEVIATLQPRTREMWVAADGSGRIRETAGDVVFLNERGRAAWVAMGSPPLGRTTNGEFGPGGLSSEDLTRLPTDPTALAEVIRERAARTQVPIDDEMFVMIGDLLRPQGAPSNLRAALYKVAAAIPGVELVRDARDHAGRPGVAVAKTSSYTGLRHRNVLIFDPRTSALLGEEHVLLEQAAWVDAAPPVVVGYAVYLESRIVEKLPAE
jgi:hypothetical protein